MYMKTELCNMCMITDPEGRVLVQERLPKPSNAWSGLTFPGGHVEPGETVVASVIREVHEGTGLTITDVVPAGYIYSLPFQKVQHHHFFFVKDVILRRLQGFPNPLQLLCREGLAHFFTSRLLLEVCKRIQIFAQQPEDSFKNIQIAVIANDYHSIFY